MKIMILISGTRLASPSIIKLGLEINSSTWLAIAAIMFVLILLYIYQLVFRKPDKF